MVGSTTRLPAIPQPAHSIQQTLAASLVECMGRDSAIHVCQVNGWEGVLQLLRDPQAVPTLR